MQVLSIRLQVRRQGPDPGRQPAVQDELQSGRRRRYRRRRMSGQGGQLWVLEGPGTLHGQGVGRLHGRKLPQVLR